MSEKAASRYDYSVMSDEELETFVVEVSAGTMALLRQLAQQLNCTVNAVLEEAIREYALGN